jgi:hypothetical protein
MKDYKADLNRRHWEYQKSQFPDRERLFEHAVASDVRPPIILSEEALRNVI